MIIRKSSIILTTCNSLQSGVPFGAPYKSSTSSSSETRTGTRPRAWPADSRNGYATSARGDEVRGWQGHSQKAPHLWPTELRGQTCPTPYQIFDLKQDGTYSKARYYELVKLYHPDRKGSAVGAISDKVKMERYRLIVSAHAILSDPVKRNAYDRFGAGWNGKAEVRSHNQTSAHHQAGPFSQSWSDPNDPVWQNSTWEDWERWRARQNGESQGKPGPVYMTNSVFVTVVMALAVVGSSWNYNRAHDAGSYFLEQRDIVHDRTSKELRRARHEAATLDSKQNRIDYFVRQRDATSGNEDYEPIQEERAHRVLRDIETCGSEQIRESQT